MVLACGRSVLGTSIQSPSLFYAFLYVLIKPEMAISNCLGVVVVCRIEKVARLAKARISQSI